MKNRRFVLPFVLPVASFALVIFTGSLLLWFDAGSGNYWDALFISTSSVCVTGLSSIDTATAYSSFGHVVMLVLMQLGGLGITTYSTLIFFIMGRRVRLFDRLAVGQLLLNDNSFHLGFFIRRVVKVILGLELCGALALYIMEPECIGVFNSLFLAVSSFCNAGFTPWSDNLMGWQQHVGLNVVVMCLIICGGLGFAVLDECLLKRRHFVERIQDRLCGRALKPAKTLSFQARMVLTTTLALVLGGAILIFLTEYFVNKDDFFEPGKVVLPALFQSVSSRTAGFNTANIGKFTDLALLAIIGLMFIGGSSGSCAGGIKIGTFRILSGTVKASLKGKSQVSVAGKGISMATVNRAFMLFFFAVFTIVAATFALTLSEGGGKVHGETPFQVLDLFFEVVSAFATVGLSTGVTPHLSVTGKLIVCVLMFVGRLGPIWLITAIQQAQRDSAYRLPEIDLPVG